jgi:glycosyltransferase involved in cell wall biosynthesis
MRCAGRHYGPLKGSAVVVAQQVFSRAERALVDVFLPVSAAAAADNGLDPCCSRCVVIPNVVPPARDSHRHAALLNQLPDVPFLLFAGDLRPAKGVEILLDAYRHMTVQPPLVLIGKVWPETPREFPPGVKVLCDWPNSAVREAMRRCLALAAPSILPEPFGLVVVETLAAGRPVVASAVGGIPEIVRHEVEGLLVPAGDVDALTAALDRLVADPGLRESLAENARRRAAGYEPAVIVPRIEAAYGQVIRAREFAARQ